MIHFGNVDVGSTLYIPFSTYGATGASITLTGLAVTDIEIYKNGSTTQRSSDAGYALLDTDGIDFDGITGIHGFSIDLSDNTDSGFYASGSQYWVVVSAVTVDSVTVNFIAATFSIGYQNVNAVEISGDATAADNAEAFFDGTGYAGTNNVIPTVTTLTNLPSIPANWLTAAGTAADFTTEIQTGLATASALSTLDTTVNNLVADIGSNGAGLTALPWNSAWDAEVQSEVIDGLTAYTAPTLAQLVSAESGVVGSVNLYTLQLMQLALRSDTAIATDNATQLGHINANLGSGAGNYDNTTDSVEALRDHADTITVDIAALPTASENATGLLDLADGIETGQTLRAATRIMFSALAGKVSGAGTGTEVFRNVGDSKDRITSTVDSNGNRTAVTVDGT